MLCAPDAPEDEAAALVTEEMFIEGGDGCSKPGLEARNVSVCERSSPGPKAIPVVAADKPIDTPRMTTFKAYRTFQDSGVVTSKFVEMTTEELDSGEVVIRAEYSTINYKDALSYNGAGKIMRKFPTNAGVDVAGTVESSSDRRFKAGDPVLVGGYDFGVAHDGGFAERVRAPADWVVQRPKSMSAKDAMALGTAGLTAALSVELMEHNGLAPESGPVAVTGATGGVGSIAVEILAKRGYDVVAITGKEDESDYLKKIGAKSILLRSSIDLTARKPLGRATYAGAVDNLGGDILAWLISAQRVAGTVAAVGLAASHDLHTSVMPFILRGVHLLGVDSVNCPMPKRRHLWNLLAGDWRPDHLHEEIRTVSFEDLPAQFDAYLKSRVRGRTVVRIGA